MTCSDRCNSCTPAQQGCQPWQVYAATSPLPAMQRSRDKRSWTRLRADAEAHAAACLLKVALVGGQALGGQLLEDVVQHQVHAPLHQLVGALRGRGSGTHWAP